MQTTSRYASRTSASLGEGYSFIALRFGTCTISVGYDFGLIDLSKGSNLEKEGTEENSEGLDSTPSAKNRSLSIKLGYKF